MARVNAHRMNQMSDEDFDVYRDVNLKDHPELLDPGTFEVVLIAGNEEDNTDANGAKTGSVRWGLMLGFTLAGDLKAHRWFNVSEDAHHRWKNMLKTLDPGLFEGDVDEEVDISPKHYVGRRFRVRIDFGKGEGFEDKLFVQKFLPSNSEQAFVPKRSAAPVDEISEDDLPF